MAHVLHDENPRFFPIFFSPLVLLNVKVLLALITG